MISKIKGLKYPDEYFIRFFFKEGFHNQKNLTFLEFGCGNGNNLSLPASYGHKVIGVDIKKENIKNAKYNFQLMGFKEYTFFNEDMREFDKDFKVDVINLPNIINYICKKDFKKFLEKIKLYNAKKLFIRFRSIKDFRNGFGESLGNDCYKVTDNLTNEKGAINCLYTLEEMLEYLKILNLHNFYTFELNFENLAKNKKILNSDIVIWGDIG